MRHWKRRVAHQPDESSWLQGLNESEKEKMQKERDVVEEKHLRDDKNPERKGNQGEEEEFGCKAERRRAETTVKSARCERQEADDRERVKRASEGEGSEEQLFTDRRADTWPRSAGRW